MQNCQSGFVDPKRIDGLLMDFVLYRDRSFGSSECLSPVLIYLSFPASPTTNITAMPCPGGVPTIKLKCTLLELKQQGSIDLEKNKSIHLYFFSSACHGGFAMFPA